MEDELDYINLDIVCPGCGKNLECSILYDYNYRLDIGLCCNNCDIKFPSFSLKANMKNNSYNKNKISKILNNYLKNNYSIINGFIQKYYEINYLIKNYNKMCNVLANKKNISENTCIHFLINNLETKTFSTHYI